MQTIDAMLMLCRIRPLYTIFCFRPKEGPKRVWSCNADPNAMGKENGAQSKRGKQKEIGLILFTTLN